MSRHWPGETVDSAEGSPRTEWEAKLVQTAEMSVAALRAVMMQLSPSPAWRSEIAEMAAGALAAAKGLMDRESWGVGWKLVYMARSKPGGRDYR